MSHWIPVESVKAKYTHLSMLVLSRRDKNTEMYSIEKYVYPITNQW